MEAGVGMEAGLLDFVVDVSEGGCPLTGQAPQGIDANDQCCQ